MSNHRNKPSVAVSMGDPGGIGPEVLVKALADPDLRHAANFRIFGLGSVMLAAAEQAGIEPYWWRVERGSDIADAAAMQDVLLIDSEPGTIAERNWPARDNKASGHASFHFVEDTIACCRLPERHPLRADAITTAPISKAAWNLAGFGRFPGHTELLAVRFNAQRAGMMFVSPSLKVMLATVHIPLLDLRDILTIGCVFDAIDLGAQGCHQLGIHNPRIAVCGLNPHAGEGGIIGDEDQRLIRPAIDVAQHDGIDATGPYPADTLFGRAVGGEFDLVVAMYHDQGLIPVKLLHRDQAVNSTIGLPVPRTSPDHGTAFDIAGKDRAEPGSMHEALSLAIQLAANAKKSLPKSATA